MRPFVPRVELLVWLCLLGRASPGVSSPALAASLQVTPTVALVDPASAPNDLDIPIIIAGTDFVPTPIVCLGNTSLDEVSWVSSATLEATVPWGLEPGVYTLTVENPGGDSGDLTDAFTVTEGIGVWNAGAFYGGKVDQIVINPITPTTVYAVSEHTGVFRSRDGGDSWSLKVAGPAYIVRRLALDLLSPNRLYLNTGRSTDEGDTWIPCSEGGGGMDAYPHPSIAGTVYASSWLDFMGCRFSKSTDFGETWDTISETAGVTDTCVAEVTFHPVNTQTLVAGTENGNIFRSTDGGETWAFASKPAGAVNALAFNPFAANEVWVSGRHFGATLRNTDEEYSEWIPVGEPVGSRGFDCIAFAPLGWGDAFSQTVFVAGPSDAYKSTDGGATWEVFGPQAQVLDIILHPTDPNVIYASSTCGGVYKTLDGGATWQQVNQGLTAMAPYALATVPGQPDLVYAAVEGCEGVFRGTRGGSTWQFLEVEGATVEQEVGLLVDPNTTTRLYRGGYGAVYRSDDGGQTWPFSGTLPPPDECVDNIRIRPTALQADASQPGVLLAGAKVDCNTASDWFEMGDIYRSSDGGQTWTTTLTPGQVINPVSVLAHDHLTPTIVYAGSKWEDKVGGDVIWRSIDGGQSWQPIDMPAMADGYAIDAIATEPVAPYRVFVGSWADSGGALYFSADHGETWQRPLDPLYAGGVETLHFASGNPPVLYTSLVGSEAGLLRSTDGASSWTRADGALGQVPIYSLAPVAAADRAILYAGTTGGYVEDNRVQAWSRANIDGTLVNAGVYRYTTRRIWSVYVPLIVQASTR